MSDKEFLPPGPPEPEKLSVADIGWRCDQIIDDAVDQYCGPKGSDGTRQRKGPALPYRPDVMADILEERVRRTVDAVNRSTDTSGSHAEALADRYQDLVDMPYLPTLTYVRGSFLALMGGNANAVRNVRAVLEQERIANRQHESYRLLSDITGRKIGFAGALCAVVDVCEQYGIPASSWIMSRHYEDDYEPNSEWRRTVLLSHFRNMARNMTPSQGPDNGYRSMLNKLAAEIAADATLDDAAFCNYMPRILVDVTSVTVQKRLIDRLVHVSPEIYLNAKRLPDMVAAAYLSFDNPALAADATLWMKFQRPMIECVEWLRHGSDDPSAHDVADQITVHWRVRQKAVQAQGAGELVAIITTEARKAFLGGDHPAHRSPDFVPESQEQLKNDFVVTQLLYHYALKAAEDGKFGDAAIFQHAIPLRQQQKQALLTIISMAKTADQLDALISEKDNPALDKETQLALNLERYRVHRPRDFKQLARLGIELANTIDKPEAVEVKYAHIWGIQTALLTPECRQEVGLPFARDLLETLRAKGVPYGRWQALSGLLVVHGDANEAQKRYEAIQATSDPSSRLMALGRLSSQCAAAKNVS